MQNSQTPKNFFIQVGIFFSLYVSAISFLVFLFSVIDDVFPKALYYYSDSSSGIRFSISTLIVVFPLFIWLSRVYRKFIETNLELKESKLRKWIIYFTLFVTGATIAGDMIVLVNTFLGGEDFTTGFVLKVLSVFVVAGAIFTFCLKDLKGYFDGNPKQSKFWSMVVSVIVLLSVVGGFVLIGSPSTQRSKNYDNQRVSDLQSIQWQVTYYYQSKGKTPATLSDLNDPLSGFVLPTDPESSEQYTYNRISDVKFSLCADFNLENSKELSTSKPMDALDQNWVHGAGNVCFERTIDPDKYPRIQNKI
jgi:hypothetical protein